MAKELLIGVVEAGVMHTDADPPFDLETRFRMAKESSVFDYFDKTPPADRYSIFENSVACADWLRQTWAEINTTTAAAQ